MIPASRAWCLLLLSGAVAGAQVPTAPPVRGPLARPINPAAPMNAPLPAGAPSAAAVPTRPLSEDDPVGGLEFPSADVKDVLYAYERLTGKHLIYDVQAIGQVNIVVKADLRRAEAIRIIEISLLMNGFTLVPVEGNLVKVLGTGHNPRGYGIPIISDEMEIPAGEQVITYVFKLRFADPQEVATTLQNYIVQASSGYNQLLPLPKSQAIVLTENSLIIRKILQFIKEVDVAPANVVSEFIPLERADAKDVLEKLEKIFEKTQTAGTTPGAPGAPGAPRNVPAQPRVAPDGTPIPANVTATSTGPDSAEINAGELSEDSIIVGKIRLTADTRTNRIHIVTRPRNLDFLRRLISEFDADVPFGEPAIRPLRFIAAGDYLNTIAGAIAEPGQKVEDATGGGAGGGQRSGQTGSRTGNSATGNGNLLGSNSNSGLGGSSSGGSTGASLSESLNTEERDTIPEAKIVGNTKIIADKRANTIIVLGNREVKNRVFQLLDELDVRPAQVMLHTIIGELNLSNNRNLGVNYILGNGSSSTLFGTTTTTGSTTNANVTTGSVTTGSTGTTTGTGTGTTTTSSAPLSLDSGGNPILNLANLVGNQNVTQLLTAGGGGLSGFIAAGNAFNALISALDATDNFRVVSRPSIFTTNNKKAIIASGEEIAVPVNINGGFTGSNATNGGLVTQSSIQYKTVALQLEVLPLINSEREVTLDVVQKVDQQSGSDTIDNNAIPRIATRVLKTTVSVPNQGTLVLGGLIKDSNDKNLSGIPYLMKLPVVGSLFRKTTVTKQRTELIILIRPEVIVGPSAGPRIREKEMEYLHLEPDLESTIYPANTRKKVIPEAFVRHSAVDLRDPAVQETRTTLPGK